jgi:hypothetical protein
MGFCIVKVGLAMAGYVRGNLHPRTDYNSWEDTETGQSSLDMKMEVYVGGMLRTEMANSDHEFR